jgi:hypothetical protein
LEKGTGAFLSSTAEAMVMIGCIFEFVVWVFCLEDLVCLFAWLVEWMMRNLEDGWGAFIHQRSVIPGAGEQ